MKYREEIQSALEAGRKAGKIMDDADVGRMSSNTKSSETDLVTEADRECQRVIIETLKQNFPNSGFLAEEQDVIPNDQDKIWIIDPIDGTLNFSKGFPYFCCSIALEIDGEIKAGVILSPESALNEYYFASSDSGSYRADLDKSMSSSEKIGVSKMEMEGARIGFDFSEEESKKRHFEGEKANWLLEKGAAIGRPGAAALNLSMVARGSMDGMIAHVNKWDFAAGSIILKEAGGKIRTQYMRSNDLYEIIGSNGNIQQELLNIARANHTL